MAERTLWVVMAYDESGSDAMPLAFYRSHSQALRDRRLSRDADVIAAKKLLNVRIMLERRQFDDVESKEVEHMGTRSHTHVIEKWQGGDETLLCTIYRQFDGYPTGHGQALAEFLQGMEVVNGIRLTKDDAPEKRQANGGGCLAAQLIKHLKDGIGSIYMTKPGIDSDGIDYEYHVIVEQTSGGGSITLRCTCGFLKGRVLFEGKPEDWDASKVEGVEASA